MGLAIFSTWSAFAQRLNAIKTVRGIVVDEEGKAITGAEVSLGFQMRTDQNDEKVIQTAADGRFSLTVKLNGTGLLVVARAQNGTRQGFHALPYEAKD